MPTSSIPMRVATVALALTLVSCSSERTDVSTAAITIDTVSNRPDLVSGGDALVEIGLPAGTDATTVTVTLNGKDITAAFRSADGRVLGLVTGLEPGDNTLTAVSGELTASTTLTDHPRGGPVFSGPQIEPWICATVEPRAGDDDTAETVASGLSTEPTDEQCNIPAEVSYYYRTTDECGRDPADPRRFIPCFKPYDREADAPADLAEVTSAAGRKIPYVVRVERGTINRGIYDVAVVHEEGAEWGPFTKTSTWNGALLHLFGGSTGTPRRQYPPNSRWSMDEALARGFMVSVSSLTDQALNSNKVVAAETLMMLKEHITETYGEISHTIGFGCSGGSIMQLVIAGTYPGLLDGILPSCTYPDSVTTGLEVSDCVLLENYFASDTFGALTAGMDEEAVRRKRAAIAGHMDEKACPAWSRSFGHARIPGNFERGGQPYNNCRLPKNWVFDAESNPDGIRCSQTDHEIAVWGREPGQDYGRLLGDNTGIMYGLEALRSGQITAEEFVALNENIGGTDVESQISGRRASALEESIRVAYRVGLVTDPRQWAKVPIIDLRGNDNSGIHMNWRAFAVRDRLDSVLGHHDNHVIWRFGPGLFPSPETHLVEDALETMHAWLAAIDADPSDVPLTTKIVRNKPAAAVDFCYLGDDYETRVTDEARCDADPVLAYYGSPRQVAGGPLAENVLKCALEPLVRSDYTAEFSDDQWARLEATFPDGVCDWSKAGMGMQAAIPWLDYTNGPGGEPL